MISLKIFFSYYRHRSDNIDCKCHEPRGREYCAKAWPSGHKVKMPFFFKTLLNSGASFRQTKCKVIITKEGSTKLLISLIWRMVSCVKAWPHKSYSKTALLIENSSPLQSGIVRQTESTYTNDDQGKVCPNCKFMKPGQGFLY